MKKCRQILKAILPIAVTLHTVTATAQDKKVHDIVIHNGIVYDGSGNVPYAGELAIDDDRITYVGSHQGLVGRINIDAKRQAIAPGFINMLSHSEESFFADGRALSDLKQGITLEVLGEASMGPLNHST